MEAERKKVLHNIIMIMVHNVLAKYPVQNTVDKYHPNNM